MDKKYFKNLSISQNRQNIILYNLLREARADSI